MVAEVGPNTLDLREVHRFANGPSQLPDGLHWPVTALYREVLIGLRAASRSSSDIASIGIDSWGVDYGLLDATGALIEEPFHYRDERNARAVAAVHAVLSPARLYERTGVQFLPFNTIYQLAAGRGTAALAAARTLLLIPDLLAFWLTGVASAEMTNASTTGLLDPRTRTWALDLLDEIGVLGSVLPDLSGPGDILGPLRPDAHSETTLPPGTPVTLVGSHDTASAVVAVPAEIKDFAYISCGTWSLVGVEIEQPVLSEASRAANFTNELGVDRRVRYLRNVMGLWLLQESLRTWERSGASEDLSSLLAAARRIAPGGPVFNVDDPTLLAPGDIPARIAGLCRRSDQNVPDSRAALARCILENLAAAYARALQDAARLSGKSVQVVHLVGGGSRNELLCQLTADACAMPVVSGPVEAAAIGNALVQARAHGIVAGDLDSLRALVRRSGDLRRYEPRSRRASVIPGVA